MSGGRDKNGDILYSISVGVRMLYFGVLDFRCAYSNVACRRGTSSDLSIVKR